MTLACESAPPTHRYDLSSTTYRLVQHVRVHPSRDCAVLGGARVSEQVPGVRPGRRATLDQSWLESGAGAWMDLETS